MSYQAILEAFELAKQRSVPISPKDKALLPHERELLAKGELENITHAGSSCLWLESAVEEHVTPGYCRVYRPMGDKEICHLVAHGQLPDTQPYQAIMQDAPGRIYSDKYLNGKKRTDTHPTTVVEFTVPLSLIQELQSIQSKVEDGCISCGLGSKAGNGLAQFNSILQEDEHSRFRIVKVKRARRTKRPK